jgi:glycerol-3-phosphate cytidylyltransferase
VPAPSFHGPTVITFGTFDVLHVGHLRLLERARSLGARLVVGVSTDDLNEQKKGRRPVFPEHERILLVRSLKYVDETFFEESLERKRDYIQIWHADTLVIGDDWRGKFDDLQSVCSVVYLPRTPSVSTSTTIESIRRP